MKEKVIGRKKSQMRRKRKASSLITGEEHNIYVKREKENLPSNSPQLTSHRPQPLICVSSEVMLRAAEACHLKCSWHHPWGTVITTYGHLTPSSSVFISLSLYDHIKFLEASFPCNMKYLLLSYRIHWEVPKNQIHLYTLLFDPNLTFVTTVLIYWGLDMC